MNDVMNYCMGKEIFKNMFFSFFREIEMEIRGRDRDIEWDRKRLRELVMFIFDWSIWLIFFLDGI